MSDRTEQFLISRDDLEDLVNAVNEYQQMALNVGNAWGQQSARDLAEKLRAEAGFMAYAYMRLWFGRNHQKIQPGEEVWYLDGDSLDPDYYPAEVLSVHTHGAVVLDGDGVEWHAWHSLHRGDRLHSEPTFDVANVAAVAAHMGTDAKPEHMPEPVAPYFLPVTGPRPAEIGHRPEPSGERRYGTDWLGAVVLDLPTTPEGLAEGKAYVDGLVAKAFDSAGRHHLRVVTDECDGGDRG